MMEKDELTKQREEKELEFAIQDEQTDRVADLVDTQLDRKQMSIDTTMPDTFTSQIIRTSEKRKPMKQKKITIGIVAAVAALSIFTVSAFASGWFTKTFKMEQDGSLKEVQESEIKTEDGTYLTIESDQEIPDDAKVSMAGPDTLEEACKECGFANPAAVMIPSDFTYEEGSSKMQMIMTDDEQEQDIPQDIPKAATGYFADGSRGITVYYSTEENTYMTFEDRYQTANGYTFKLHSEENAESVFATVFVDGTSYEFDFTGMTLDEIHSILDQFAI